MKMVFPKNGGFSIAMLVYQRVTWSPKIGVGWKMIFHFGCDFFRFPAVNSRGSSPGKFVAGWYSLCLYFVLVLTKKQPLYIPRNP